MKRLFFLALSCISIAGFAQEKFCGAAELINQELKNNIQARLNHDKLEQFTASWIEQNGGYRTSTHEYVIPLVIHVFHDYTSNTFVSKDHVLDAVRILNRDIKALNPDTAQIDSAFKNLIGGLNIRFELAKIGPDGQCTDGITRTATPLTYQGDERLKSLISWDTDKYMNIWLCRALSFNAGGYAYYPGTAPSPSQEGIVCINTQFGSVSPSFGTTSNLSARTITHEVGHYLNLQHTWGNSNSPVDPNNCNIDDQVDDTPRCVGTRSTCPLNQNSCADTVYYGFDQKDNTQNYMDYAPCESMFTKGQATRMEAALNSMVGSRELLWQDSNLIATGVHPSLPVVACAMNIDFRANKNYICVGDPIQLTDYSWNGTAQSRTWYFTGPGTVSISNPNDSMPTVTFNAPGYYSIELEITSKTGATSSKTLTDYVYVFPAAASTNQYQQDFEQASAFDSLYQVNNAENFKITGTGAGGSIGSALLDARAISSEENITLSLPALDFSNSGPITFSFDYAYARYDSTSNDELKVYFSNNCGATWIPRINLNTNALHTSNNSFDTDFFPSTSEWKNKSQSISLSANPTLIRFEVSNPSSKIYLDNIQVKEANASVQEFLLDQVTLYPNPSNGDLNISFSNEFQDFVKISVLDSRAVAMENFEFNGNETKLDLSALPKGVYLIELEYQGYIKTKKWIKF